MDLVDLTDTTTFTEEGRKTDWDLLRVLHSEGCNSDDTEAVLECLTLGQKNHIDLLLDKKTT